MGGIMSYYEFTVIQTSGERSELMGGEVDAFAVS
jgi:hypothetical protein